MGWEQVGGGQDIEKRGRWVLHIYETKKCFGQ